MEVFGIPVKTQLGVDELRGRARSLGQRHRTVLLLIDGRRSVGEVLNLAQQAGAQPSHFEDLLRLGMAELPASEVSTPAPPPEPRLQARPQAGPQAQSGTRSKFGSEFGSEFGSQAESEFGSEFVPSFESEPPQDAFDAPIFPVDDEPEFPDLRIDPLPAAPAAPAERNPRTRQLPATVQPLAEAAGDPNPTRPPPPARAVPKDTRALAPAPSAQAAPRRLADSGDRPAQFPRAEPATSATASRHAPLPRQAGNSAARTDSPTPNAPAAPLSIRDEVLGMVAPKVGAPVPNRAEQDKFDRVRALLVETLRFDSPLFGARLLLRLRDAKTIDDLIELVWVIERHLAGVRYARKEMVSLHQARELLGLGNTVVPDD